MELDPGVDVLHLDCGEAEDHVVRDGYSYVPVDVDAGRAPAPANALLGDRLGRVRTEERGNGSRLLLAWRPEHRHG